jgi:hypothetical protein
VSARRAILAAAFFVGCVPQPPAPSPAVVATSPPTAASVPTSSPAPADLPLPTPTLLPTPQPIAFPDVELIAGGILGELQVYRAGKWSIEAQICPNADPHNAVRSLEVSADGRTAFVQCSRTSAGRDLVDAFVFDLVTKQKRAIPGITIATVGPISPDGRQLVVNGPGECPMPAPVCQTRYYLLDLATGTRTEILPSDYWLGLEFRWTSAGLTYFRPECAEAGCAGVAKAGTYHYGSTTRSWTRVSRDRVVATAPGRVLTEVRRSFSSQEPVAVVETWLGQERRLTPPGVVREIALALLADGRALTWRFEPGSEFEGQVVTYRDGHEERRTRGRFSGFMNATVPSVASDWFLAGELSGAPSWKILAYSTQQDAFASMQPTFGMQQFRLLPKPLAPSKMGACSAPTSTTRAVIDRYLALSTSGDADAVRDCFAIGWRAQFPSQEDGAARWATAGPVTSADIRLVDRTHGCDRYAVNWRTRDAAFGNYMIVGMDGDRPRIVETGTALVRAEHSTRRCD